MSRWLPPAGGGYSGRSVTTDRYESETSAARHPTTTMAGKSVKHASGKVLGGRFVKVTPKGKGPAGVSRAK